MKILYKTVQNRLFNLSNKPKGHALKRLNNLSGFVCGMIRKGNSNLPDIGSGLIQDIDANSKTTAAKRFVSNKYTDFSIHFLPFLVAFLRGILAFSNMQTGIYLVIDGTQVGKDNGALMISLRWRNRGIPIFWITKLGGKGHFKSEDHEFVLQEAIKILKPILPKDVAVTLLGDGEFDSIDLQKFCKSIHWDYVFRTANNTILYEENGDSFKAKGMSVDKTHNTLFFNDVEFTKQRFKYVNFLLWHHKECEEPLPLISSIDCPLKIMEAYRKRYGIEALFKDLKSTSFNLHKTRLTKAYDISNLIMVAALAFNLLAILAEQFKDNPIRKYIQRIREDKREFSFYTFALELLNYLLAVF